MTFEELAQAGFVAHHRCDACGVPVGYLVHPEMAAAVYDSSCDCGTQSGPTYRLLTRQELAELTLPTKTAPAS